MAPFAPPTSYFIKVVDESPLDTGWKPMSYVRASVSWVFPVPGGP